MKTINTYNKSLAILCLMIGSLLFSQSCSAHKTITPDVETSIEELKNSSNATIRLHKDLGIASFVKFPHDSPMELSGSTVHNKAISFLEANKGIYDLKEVEGSFTLKSTETDQYGMQRVMLEQAYHGVPVFDGKLIFHFNKEEKLTAVNGNYTPNIDLDPVPYIDQAQAGDIAIQTINDQDINYSGVPLEVRENKLYVFQAGITNGKRGSLHLAYHVEVWNQTDVREYVIIDAHSGKVIEQYTGIAHAIDRVIYEGSVSTIVWEEGDVFPGTLNIWQQNAVETSRHTYNFFKNAFGFISYDNADGQMKVVTDITGGICPNAWWNGVSVQICDEYGADDTMAHEWAHGYTDNTCDLVYNWQSGAINEGFSDIWGETIDILNNYEDDDEDLSLRTECNSSDRWMRGEDNVIGVVRDMWEPTCLGSPGSVSDEEFWCTGGDNGGVHTNSGVVNHSYALLVDGGNYNGQTIAPLGFTKAAHIYWRVQSQYLTQTSGFEVFADALESACADLIGIDLEGLSTEGPVGLSGEVITADDLIQVQNVIAAVEFDTTPADECFETVLQPLENELCAAAFNDPIFFEDWESGFGDWTTEEVPVFPDLWVPRNWQLYSGPEVPQGGTIAYGPAAAFGNCIDNGQDGVLRLTSPIITLPGDANSSHELAFVHALDFEQDWDGGNVKYSLNGGEWTLIPMGAFVENPYNVWSLIDSDNPMSSEACFTGGDGAAGGNTGTYFYGTSVVDLAFIGVEPNATLQIRFEVGTDRCWGEVGWGLDDVMVYDCGGAVSIEEMDIAKAIEAYPNPSAGQFQINMPTSTDITYPVTYHIINSIGQVVEVSNLVSENSMLDLTHLAGGLYQLRIEELSKSIMINR